MLGITGTVIYFLFIRKPAGSPVEFSGSIQSSFEEQSEYVNRQAQFSIKYPNSWSFEIKELGEAASSSDEISDTTKGIRLRGKTGYIDLYWGEEYEKGGCTQRVTQLQISGETIEVCNFKQKDDSEIWNEIVNDRGDLLFWANAYAASPSAQTRTAILEVFSTLKFLE